ncbi:MAG: DUF4968 domain-containing protein, partial [Bacteroidales bacterium]|nr:DUF4968 domain-containing protein [Bacteroidales bacterium]
MKRLLSLLILISLSTAVYAQNPDVKITFYTPDIVRVTKTPANSVNTQPNLVVTLSPQEVNVKKTTSGGVTTYASDKLKVTVDQNGKVAFALAKGAKLLEEKSFAFSPITSGTDKGSFKISQSFKLAANETVYGVGTIQNGKLERNNTETLIEQSNLEDFQNVIQSIKGWGIYWDNYSRGKYSEKNSIMTLEGEAGDVIDYYFMYGGNPDGVIALMRQLSGKVPMFPLWTFGYWQSKERYKTQDEIIGVVEKYRTLGVPLDGIIQDWQYWGNNYLWNAMDFLSESFPDGKGMIKRIHDMNAHIMISIWASFGPMT